MEILLDKIGFDSLDKEIYFDIYSVIGEDIEKIADKYFADEINIDEAQSNAHSITHKVSNYAAELLLAVRCTALMQKEYAKCNIPEEIFDDTVRDIKYKLEECKKFTGEFGITNIRWFDGFFKLKRFAFGRLQFDVIESLDNDIIAGDKTLPAGSFALSCHIPSSGPLLHDLCIGSYKKVYDYFKSRLNGSFLPILCDSWLLYPNYKALFGKNTQAFIADFLIYDIRKSDTFSDAWRVFNMPFNNNLSQLPQNTSLQKNFAKYIEAGCDFGNGLGILFFDGEKVI